MTITCGIYLYCLSFKRFLICRAARSNDRWSIPKGLRDSDETSYHTACREFKEETGLDIDKLDLFETSLVLPAAKYNKRNKVLESFVLITTTDLSNFEFKCSSLVNNDFPEVDKFEWITLEELNQNEKIHYTQRQNAEIIKRWIQQYETLRADTFIT